MSKEFKIRGSFLINNSPIVTGITNDSGLTSNSPYNLVTEYAVKQYVLTSAPAGYLSGLTDVNISGLTQNDILVYSGGSWVNEQPQDALAIFYTSAQTDSKFLSLSGGTITGNLGITGNLNVTGNTKLNTLTLQSGVTVYNISTDSGFTNADNNSLSTSLAIKNYISAVTGTTLVNTFVLKAGDTMTGTLTVPTLTATTVQATNGNFTNLTGTTITSTTGNISTVNSTTVNNSGTITSNILSGNTVNVATINSTTINNIGTVTSNIISGNTATIANGNFTNLTGTTITSTTGNIATVNSTTGNITTVNSTTVNFITASGGTITAGTGTFNGNVNVNGGNLTVVGNANITGDLYVSGTTVTVNVRDLNVADNIITLNSGETNTGVTRQAAGLKIDRGAAIPYYFVFDEITDTFRIGESTATETPNIVLSGDTQAVATREDSPISTGIAFWNNTAKRFDTNSALTWSASTLKTTGNFQLNSGAIVNDIISDSALTNASNNNLATALAIKLYVADLVASGVTAENGLTETAGVIKLGGSLTQNTNIYSDTFSLNLTGSSVSLNAGTLGKVLVQSNGVSLYSGVNVTGITNNLSTSSTQYELVTATAIIAFANSNYVIKSGDTMTGTLTVPTLTATTVQATNGNFTYLTGTTITSTTGNIATINSTTVNNSGTITSNILSGNTATIANGTFVYLTGTTITSTTGNIATVNSTTVNNSGTITSNVLSGNTLNILNANVFGNLDVNGSSSLNTLSLASGVTVYNISNDSGLTNVDDNSLITSLAIRNYILNLTGTTLVNTFVLKAGDTMTGDLTISTLSSSTNKMVLANPSGKLETTETYVHKVSATGITTGTNAIDIFNKTISNGTEWLYVVNSGSNYRAGSIIAAWDGTNVEWNEYSTNDLGNTTPVDFSVAINGSNIELRAIITSGTWDIKLSRQII